MENIDIKNVQNYEDDPGDHVEKPLVFPRFDSRYVYSASVNSFYEVPELEYYEAAGTLPADLLEVEDSVFVEFTQGPFPEGKTRVAGENGLPVWVDAPPPSREEMEARQLAQRDALLRNAALRIAPLQDAVDLGEATEDEEARLIAWKRYRIELNRLINAEGWPMEFKWPVQPEEV